MATSEWHCCSVVVGSEWPSGAGVVSASAVLVPERLLSTLSIALNDPVEIESDKVTCIGPCILQPHSSASASSDEVILLGSVPYRGHYDLPVAPLKRLPARIRALRRVPDSFEIALQADSPISLPSHVQKLLCCQRMVVRPGSVFELRYPGRGSIRCSVTDCRPSLCRISTKTTVVLSTGRQSNSMAAKFQAFSECETVLGPAFVRLMSFLRLSSWRPKGILVHGAPGAGKSLITEVAGLLTNLSISYLSGEDLAAMAAPGDAERLLSETFANGCDIVCIDSIESIAGKRDAVRSDRSRILGQLLTLMAGANSHDVVVIGITTKPDDLDPALRRPGRFDQEVQVPVPDIDQRAAILRFYLQKMEPQQIRNIAERSVGFTGSDLYSLANECALSAAIRGSHEIAPKDVEAGFASVGVSSSRRDAVVKLRPTQWSDIGGYDEIKSKLQRLIHTPIRFPEQYRLMGLQLPRGLLLYGPPGCCKTTLARALVSSSSDRWSILKLDAASVYSSFVGDAEAAIRRVFMQARSNLPCMLLLDEIDAIVTSRGLQNSGSERVQERILSTLLNEMDGVAGADQILVVASTNRPQMLDDALLRPGRFDHLFYVGLPDEACRLEILKVHTRSMPLAADVDLEQLSLQLDGYTGAEIENLCREAALHALRSNINCSVVSKADFSSSLSDTRPTVTSEMCQMYWNFASAREPNTQKSINSIPYGCNPSL